MRANIEVLSWILRSRVVALFLTKLKHCHGRKASLLSKSLNEMFLEQVLFNKSIFSCSFSCTRWSTCPCLLNYFLAFLNVVVEPPKMKVIKLLNYTVLIVLLTLGRQPLFLSLFSYCKAFLSELIRRTTFLHLLLE